MILPFCTFKSIPELVTVGLPVVNVTPLVLINPPPFTVIPFSLAKMKSAFCPATSIVPLIAETLLPVTSLNMAEADFCRLGLCVTIPPVFETYGSFVELLLKITPFPLPTLKSINLLCDIPPIFGATIFTTSIPLALVVIPGPPLLKSGLISLFCFCLALKSLAKSSVSKNPPICPVIKKATTKLKVILRLFFKLCFSNFSFNLK